MHIQKTKDIRKGFINKNLLCLDIGCIFVCIFNVISTMDVCTKDTYWELYSAYLWYISFWLMIRKMTMVYIWFRKTL